MSQRQARYRATRKRRPTADDLMLETSMYDTLAMAAHYNGFEFYHTYRSDRSEAGYPDITIAGHGRLIFWECKAEGGRATEPQQTWLNVLGQVQSAPLVELIHPHDLDRCLAELRRG